MKISDFIKAGIGTACFIGAFKLTLIVGETIALGVHKTWKDVEKDMKETKEETKEEETEEDED